MKINPLRIIFVTAWKDLQILLEDMGFLVVIILLPTIFSILMGTINQRALDSSKKSITFPVALINQDNGAYGAQIVKILEDMHVLDLTSPSTSEEARQQVLDSEVVAAVVIPPDLTQNVDAYKPSQIVVLVDRNQQSYGEIVTGIMKEVLSPIVLVGELSYGIRTLLADHEPYQQAGEAAKRGFVAQSLAANMAQVQKMQADPWVRLQVKNSAGKDLVIVPENIFTMVVPSFCVMFAFFIVFRRRSAERKTRRHIPPLDGRAASPLDDHPGKNAGLSDDRHPQGEPHLRRRQHHFRHAAGQLLPGPGAADDCHGSCRDGARHYDRLHLQDRSPGGHHRHPTGLHNGRARRLLRLRRRAAV